MGKVVSETDTDVQLLLKEIMPVTQAGLEKQMGFAPVGALIDLEGRVRLVELDADAAGEAKARAGLLKAQLRNAVESGAVRSAAMAADVMMWRKRDGDEASNAVSVHMEHQDGYCVDLLIPYKVKKGLRSRFTSKQQILFRKMIAQESERVFWAASAASEV